MEVTRRARHKQALEWTGLVFGDHQQDWIPQICPSAESFLAITSLKDQRLICVC